MSLFLKMYLVSWLIACGIALILMYRNKNIIELFKKAYWKSLFKSWKLITFFISATGIIVVAPYTGDPTWDYFDAIVISILTYFTAPWTLAVVYRFFSVERNWSKLYIAICVWMFSASWFYDGYLLIRDGFYPVTWFTNIFASSVVYVCAGMLWNLEWKEDRGVHFSFREKDWLEYSYDSNFIKIIAYGLPFMIFVAVCVGVFLV